MFTESAELYDAIYSFKDYAVETAQIAALVRARHPRALTVLDVGCGTGEHARRLAADYHFEADGLDLDAGLLDVARRKHPIGRFVVADMSDFALGRRYDAILCLFSSIGYLVTLERIRRAIGCFRRHLSSGGVMVVEPWFAPGALEAGRVFRHTGEAHGLRVERVSRTEIDGRVSRLHFEYHVEGPDGSRWFSELHELGLFTPDEMSSAFRAEGLTADFDPVGLGRGLWVARAPLSEVPD
jgi:ubiquinone/menaquinone biosynthesis C-methylase UbiE